MARLHDLESNKKSEPLVVSRTFPAPRDLVFKAWSSAEHIKRWFCPEGCSVPQAEVDFRPGGVFAVCMRMPTGQDHGRRAPMTRSRRRTGWLSVVPSSSAARRSSPSTPPSPSRMTARGRA